MDKNLKDTQNRALQYWFSDGLAELSGGGITLILAIYFAIVQIFPESPLVTIVLFLVVFIFAFGLRRVMQQVRTRTTYLRTGYVAPKSGWENRRLLIVTIIFTILLLITQLYLILREHGAVDSISIIGGFILAFIFAMTGFETRLTRFIYLAVFCVLLGLVLAFSSLGNFWGLAVLCMATSLILFAFGSITRLTYLRQTSMLGETHDER